MENKDKDKKDEVYERARFVQDLADTDGAFQSPINLNTKELKVIQLNALTWANYDLPAKKMKITNTGHTVILSGKWNAERPFIKDGPLPGSYVFSQLHFHWGENDSEGSEHTVDGKRFPLEMHVVHFKSCYMTQESALKEKDGLTIMVYFFKIQQDANHNLDALLDNLDQIRKPHSSARINPVAMSQFAEPFSEDYFLYWGSVMTTCTHLILWFVCRKPIGISSAQMAQFRSVNDVNNKPLLRNYRDTQPLNDRNVLLISMKTSSVKQTSEIASSDTPSVSWPGPTPFKCSPDGECLPDGSSCSAGKPPIKVSKGTTNRKMSMNDETHSYHVKRLHSNNNLVPQFLKNLFPVHRNTSTISVTTTKSNMSQNTHVPLDTIYENNSLTQKRNVTTIIEQKLSTEIHTGKGEDTYKMTTTEQDDTRNIYKPKLLTSYCLETLDCEKVPKKQNHLLQENSKTIILASNEQSNYIRENPKSTSVPIKNIKDQAKSYKANIRETSTELYTHNYAEYGLKRNKILYNAKGMQNTDTIDKEKWIEHIPEKLTKLHEPIETPKHYTVSYKHLNKEMTEKQHLTGLPQNKSADDEHSTSRNSSFSELTNCESYEEGCNSKVQTDTPSNSELSSFTGSTKYGTNSITPCASNYVSLCDLLTLSKSKDKDGRERKTLTKTSSNRLRHSEIDRQKNITNNSTNTPARLSQKYTSLKEVSSKIITPHKQVKQVTESKYVDAGMSGEESSTITCESTKHFFVRPNKFVKDPCKDTDMPLELRNIHQTLQYVTPLMYSNKLAFVTPIIIGNQLTASSGQLALDIKQATVSTGQSAKRSGQSKRNATSNPPTLVSSVSTQYSDPFLYRKQDVNEKSQRFYNVSQNKTLNKLYKQPEKNFEKRGKYVQTSKVPMCRNSYCLDSSTEGEPEPQTMNTRKQKEILKTMGNRHEQVNRGLPNSMMELKKMKDIVLPKQWKVDKLMPMVNMPTKSAFFPVNNFSKAQTKLYYSTSKTKLQTNKKSLKK